MMKQALSNLYSTIFTHFSLLFKSKPPVDEEQNLIDKLLQLRSADEQKIMDAVEYSLLFNLENHYRNILLVLNITPIQLFLAIESLALLARRAARQGTRPDHFIFLHLDGQLETRYERVDSMVVFREMGALAKMEPSSAHYLVVNWIPWVLKTKPKLFLGLEAIHQTQKGTCLKIVSRSDKENLFDRWR
jgi:hypothetical protein